MHESEVLVGIMISGDFFGRVGILGEGLHRELTFEDATRFEQRRNTRSSVDSGKFLWNRGMEHMKYHQFRLLSILLQGFVMYEYI